MGSACALHVAIWASAWPRVVLWLSLPGCRPAVWRKVCYCANLSELAVAAGLLHVGAARPRPHGSFCGSKLPRAACCVLCPFSCMGGSARNRETGQDLRHQLHTCMARGGHVHCIVERTRHMVVLTPACNVYAAELPPMRAPALVLCLSRAIHQRAAKLWTLRFAGFTLSPSTLNTRSGYWITSACRRKPSGTSVRLGCGPMLCWSNRHLRQSTCARVRAQPSPLILTLLREPRRRLPA